MNRDLTVGKPSQVLVRFSLPLLGSIVFQQLYNLADSFVAGKFLGDAALAAVGNAYEVTLIYLAFAFGCNVGCNVVLSLLFGAKEYGDLRTAVNTTFIASGVLCLILMALGFAFTPALLTAINTPPSSWPTRKPISTFIPAACCSCSSTTLPRASSPPWEIPARPSCS